MGTCDLAGNTVHCTVFLKGTTDLHTAYPYLNTPYMLSKQKGMLRDRVYSLAELGGGCLRLEAYRMDVGSANIPYLLAKYLRLFTLAWVALGLERQQVATFGAAKAAETTKDAPLVDVGALVVLAPTQAPQPPPHVVRPARTIAQRLGRLEEDVHGLRGVLGEQKEVLDNMACDFSRFTTWMVFGLSRMLDQAGV
nr:hypothetical protein [Tanacetum cinerariifolium]